MKPTSTENGAPLPPPKTGRTVLALFRIGTRRCRLAAALVAVMVGLTGQTATRAFAQTKEPVVYLDAPAVSTDRATRAGETASAYSDPRSLASPEALAWLGVPGLRGDETEAPPQDAAGAFASVTAPDTEGTPSITAEAAYDAGATMLAQIEEGAPFEDGGPDEEELAANGAVRPELGDGTQAPEEEPSAGYEAPSAEQPTTPDPASSPEPVPASEPVEEPSGGEGLTLESPAPAELAAAPTEDASPAPEISLDTEPGYGATGPISEPAAESAPTAESSTEPEVQEQEVQEQEVQEQESQEPEIQEPVSPSGGDETAVLETPDSPEPGAAPAASVETGASPELIVEPSTAPTAERVEEPEDEGEEFAHANTTPVAGPEPAAETAHDDPAHGDPSAAPDTGPTSDQSDDVVLSPTSSPASEDDGASDDLVSASPAPEEAGQGDASGNVFGEPVSEVVVVQVSDAGEGTDPTASPPPNFTPPTDEIEGDRAEDTESPPWAPPSDETNPETAPTAERPTDDGAEEGDMSPSETLDEQPAGQTDLVSGETPTPPPAGDAEEPAPDTPHGTRQNDEVTTPSEEAPPVGGGQDEPQDPGSGESPADGSASPHGNPNAGTDAPVGGFDRRPDRPSQDHKDDRRDRHGRGHSSATSPDEHLRRIQQDDGGAEAVQEKARESTGRSGSGSEQQSATKFQVEGPSGGQALKLSASTPPRTEKTSDRRKSAQDRPQSFLQDPALDLDGASLRRSGVTGRVGKEPTPREQRSRAADASNPEDAEEEASKGSHMERHVDRRAERREARRAERFATRVAERKAERKEGRVAAGRAAREQAAIEQADVERAAVREQRRQNRLAAGGAFDAQRNAAPSAGRRRNASDYQETVPKPAAEELAPIQQVGTQRFTPVEQPAAVKLPPVRQVQPQTQVRQQLGSDGVGQVGGGSVARVPKSFNRAAGR